MKTVRVNLADRSYDIEIDAGNLADAGRFLTERARVTHVALITDEHVHRPYAMQVAESLGERDIEVDVIVVTPGEESKSLDVAAGLWQGMFDLGVDRRSVVVAVGGGVVGDLAGFVAATYARGLRFLQVPTTLLAQVDSSAGGKVGINLPEAKNMLGAFHQPLGVLVDTATLATLPVPEYRAGLAEVVKYGAVLDSALFDYLERNATAILDQNQEALIHVLARCCRLKADVVEQDERDETGRRAVLNFGHTFGHALETLSWLSPRPLAGEGPGVRAADRGQKSEVRGQRSKVGRPGADTSSRGAHPSPLPKGDETGNCGPLLHGEAVAIGMVCAARLAQRVGRVDGQFTTRLQRLLETFGLSVATPQFEPQQILDAMMHDKKVEYGRLQFVLPTGLGHAELVSDVSPTDIVAVLDDMGNPFVEGLL
ncbi:MAG: 3-dehydroquinate synthase [Planctomycetaceae bacterium]|nr:3-dehydroquinate synthase [Planctomycetaceae bacterium]